MSSNSKAFDRRRASSVKCKYASNKIWEIHVHVHAQSNAHQFYIIISIHVPSSFRVNFGSISCWHIEKENMEKESEGESIGK